MFLLSVGNVLKSAKDIQDKVVNLWANNPKRKYDHEKGKAKFLPALYSKETLRTLITEYFSMEISTGVYPAFAKFREFILHYKVYEITPVTLKDMVLELCYPK